MTSLCQFGQPRSRLSSLPHIHDHDTLRDAVRKIHYEGRCWKPYMEIWVTLWCAGMFALRLDLSFEVAVSAGLEMSAAGFAISAAPDQCAGHNRLLLGNGA